MIYLRLLFILQTLITPHIHTHQLEAEHQRATLTLLKFSYEVQWKKSVFFNFHRTSAFFFKSNIFASRTKVCSHSNSVIRLLVHLQTLIVNYLTSRHQSLCFQNQASSFWRIILTVGCISAEPLIRGVL